MKRRLACLSIAALITGCASLQKGADPVIVRAEQTQTIAYGTFDTFLKIDAADRGFFRTNVPAMHEFAESLRKWVVLDAQSNRQWVAYCQSLDRVKLAYKAGTATSNQVLTVLATVETALAESQQYLSQVSTNKP